MERERWLRCVELRSGDAVPCRVHISPAARRQHGRALAGVVRRYPAVEADLPESEDECAALDAIHQKGNEFQDAWGCGWHNLQEGVIGQVCRPALADWQSLADYEPPSPAVSGHFGPTDWEREERFIRSAQTEGALTAGAVAHGFFFLRLCYLRGFENLMMDVASAEPRLDHLCDMVLDFNRGIVERYMALGVDVMHFGDDLGMQRQLAISPDAWRRYVKPAYAELFGMCRDAGTHVYLHSDGYIVDIMPDLIECGVTILNPQDLCNGIDNLAAELKGRVCIDLDVDRQSIVPFGTRQEIHDLIEEEVRKLGSPQGGLMMVCGIYPPTPPENVDALCSAFEQFRTYWW